MNTTTETLLPAPIKGKFNIALTESKFQDLADKAAKLVYTEDHLEEIKQFLNGMREVDKAIEEAHKVGKADALKSCRDWDTGKNSFLAITATIKSKPQTEYEKICRDIVDRQRKAEAEKQRIENIHNGIETNALKFSSDIAACKTSEQLSYVERMINLEKGRKDKYAEFLDEAVSRYNELNALLKVQKTTVRELEENARQQLEAIQKQDDAKLIELKEKQEQVQNKAEEAKIQVQEAAINQSMRGHTSYIPTATEVMPDVRARRTTWGYEMVDKKEVMKKSPELLIVALDGDKVKAILKTLKDTNQLTGKTELVVNGIRYFEQKTF